MKSTHFVRNFLSVWRGSRHCAAHRLVTIIVLVTIPNKWTPLQSGLKKGPWASYLASRGPLTFLDKLAFLDKLVWVSHWIQVKWKEKRKLFFFNCVFIFKAKIWLTWPLPVNRSSFCLYLREEEKSRGSLNHVKPLKVTKARTSGLVNLVLYCQTGFWRASICL